MIQYLLLAVISIAAAVHFVAIPALFRFTTVQRRLMFRNHRDRTVRSPNWYGLPNGTRVHYLQSPGDGDPSEDATIGMWHIPPQKTYPDNSYHHRDYQHDNNDDDDDDDGSHYEIDNHPDHHDDDEARNRTMQKCISSFADDRPVVMYAHGSGGSRGSEHRIALYKLLCGESLDLHVVTFDYRGFADSSADRAPCARGTVRDAETVYRWIRAQGVTPGRILLWGHSLGSAILIQLLAALAEPESPMGAILEAPLTTIEDVIVHCSIARYFNYLPYFEACFVHRIVRNPETNFDSLSMLDRVRCPIAILHARDDWMVAYALGRRLFRRARRAQPAHVPRAQFFAFARRFSHSKIVYDPRVETIVRQFIDRHHHHHHHRHCHHNQNSKLSRLKSNC